MRQIDFVFPWEDSAGEGLTLGMAREVALNQLPKSGSRGAGPRLH